MEDNSYYGPGELLKRNAQMVERAVRIIHELGLEVATPDEARHILKIPFLNPFLLPIRPYFCLHLPDSVHGFMY